MERDSIVNQQVQSAIDSIITFGNNDSSNYPAPDEGEKVRVPENTLLYAQVIWYFRIFPDEFSCCFFLG